MKKKINILFVCKYNRFRSQIAEQLFSKYNKNRNIKVKSAGIIKGNYPLSPPQVKVANSLGIKLNKRPRGVDVALVKNTNLIVIVANDVPKNIFAFNRKYFQKIIIWNIKDDHTGNKKEIKSIIKTIEIKVKKLVKQLR